MAGNGIGDERAGGGRKIGVVPDGAHSVRRSSQVEALKVNRDSVVLRCRSVRVEHEYSHGALGLRLGPELQNSAATRARRRGTLVRKTVSRLVCNDTAGTDAEVFVCAAVAVVCLHDRSAKVINVNAPAVASCNLTVALHSELLCLPERDRNGGERVSERKRQTDKERAQG